ncbi:MAG: ABC transporter ATP-binding protein/permease [Gammaproteobacteria bacterium]|jgi:ATP-binding cassette subfamily B protein|nr:ABC transporter ATP-binding protein/permease [Gammaproteobacteria bacterium]MBT4811358.1 ABC transporter ATP-binding protein/permease [Thiotrichales bacterium]MBT4081959.1 ABC transporter ATP-binding protein/permease [Gammaproteobacteria bacterium]MBT4328822.1 ABC transporter ATP-binding protein/permease [Gammaproteobacteria bacterium]MBT5361231.1 ABC transporter ATP-binding protein/permease [Gammaproteobacteria bacterium]
MHLANTRMPSDSRQDWRTIKSLLPYLWNYRFRAGLAIGSLILSKFANVSVPLILKEIVDIFDQNHEAALVLPLGLLVGYGLMRAGSALFNELRDGIFAKVRHGIVREISIHFMEHLHNLSLRFHLDRKTGGITRDMERGTRSISSLFNMLLFNIIPTLVEVTLIATILLANYNPWFAIITFGTVGIYITTTFLITNWRMKFRVEMNQRDSEASTRAVDSLINYETVKYFGNERYELDQYDEQMRSWESAAVKSQTSMSALNFVQAFIIAIGVTIIMVMAGQGVVDGEMSLGDLVLVNTFLLQLFIPLGFLGVVYSQIKHSLSDIDMMFQLLEKKPEIVDREGATTLDAGRGEIHFNQVDFAYNADRPILHDISFSVPAGRKVAVVGQSGSGKSTLARLLFRFYEPQSGSITINGTNTLEITQHSLRAAIGIVPQDTVLFNHTIGYNIEYARPGATQTEVEEAARMANIHDFIEALPQGYETTVGERGLKLSGGEKQRIAIARAILKNPPIMIFDEATSSLDSAAEKVINDSLQEITTQHTTLVIAHRLSTIADAYEILVMEQGRIIERGSHTELLERGATYANMWKLQQQENSE